MTPSFLLVLTMMMMAVPMLLMFITSLSSTYRTIGFVAELHLVVRHVGRCRLLVVRYHDGIDTISNRRRRESHFSCPEVKAVRRRVHVQRLDRNTVRPPREFNRVFLVFVRSFGHVEKRVSFFYRQNRSSKTFRHYFVKAMNQIVTFADGEDDQGRHISHARASPMRDPDC